MVPIPPVHRGYGCPARFYRGGIPRLLDVALGAVYTAR